MLKYVLAALITIALLVGGFFALNTYIYDEKQGGVEDYRRITVALDGAVAEVGSGGVRYFGNDAKGDLNGDGVPDIAFIITYQGGGSGTFYYAVAAIQNAAGRYEGTNAVFLGDRIAPQTTEIDDGVLVVNYADRRSEEPMVAQPSVGATKRLRLDGNQLRPYESRADVVP